MDKQTCLTKKKNQWYCSPRASLAFIWNKPEFWDLQESLFTKKKGKDLIKTILSSLILKALFFSYPYLFVYIM